MLQSKLGGARDPKDLPDMSNPNSLKITEIQNYFVDGKILLNPTRQFIKEGTLVKMCRKTPKTRYFALFNDILVYGSIVSSGKNMLVCINQHILDLKSLSVSSLEESQIKHGFLISTPEKSFQVFASTATEKQDWIKALSQHASSTEKVVTAAVWVPDQQVSVCMVCEFTKFSTFNRRHHCRKCGKVVCTGCSTNRMNLPNLPDQRVRVCDICMEGSRKITVTGAAPLSPTSPSNPTTESKKKSSPPSGNNSDDEDGSEDEEVAEVDEDGKMAFKSRISVINGNLMELPAPSEDSIPKGPTAIARRRQFKKADEEAEEPQQQPQPPTGGVKVAVLPVAPPRKKKEDDAPTGPAAGEPAPALPPRKKSIENLSNIENLSISEPPRENPTEPPPPSSEGGNAGGESGAQKVAAARRRKFKKPEEIAGAPGGEAGAEDAETTPGN